MIYINYIKVFFKQKLNLREFIKENQKTKWPIIMNFNKIFSNFVKDFFHGELL